MVVYLLWTILDTGISPKSLHLIFETRKDADQYAGELLAQGVYSKVEIEEVEVIPSQVKVEAAGYS